MPMGEKTRLLWQDPEYRKHMSEVHSGKKHSAAHKEKIRVSLLGNSRALGCKRTKEFGEIEFLRMDGSQVFSRKLNHFMGRLS